MWDVLMKLICSVQERQIYPQPSGEFRIAFHRFLSDILVTSWGHVIQKRSSENATEIRDFRLCRIWSSHSGVYEEYYLLGYNAVQSVESQPTFRRNISPPSSGSTNRPSMKLSWKNVASIALLWRWRRYVPPKSLMTFNWLHGVIS
jgi:hypothetical protein